MIFGTIITKSRKCFSTILIMKRVIKLSSVILGAILLVASFSLNSCYRKQDTIGKVHVVNASGNAVGGAIVRVYIDPTSVPNPDPNRIDMTLTTNSSGTATFNFNDFYKDGQGGFAVLDINASQGTLLGTGVIQVEQRTTSEETIVIQ